MPKPTQKQNKSIKQAKSEKTACFRDVLSKITDFFENAKKSFNPGLLTRYQLETLTLICLIAFTGYVVLFKQHYSEMFLTQEVQVPKKSPQEIERERLKKDLRVVVKGHPIEMMIPYIAQKDRKVAAYLIGIAKKESNWGERKPVLAGVDCFNYWGFRAERERMGSGGHTCFDSPKDAVDAVSIRIAQIIERNDAESAKDMLVWKCGSDCSATGGQAAANKWARDVDFYAEKVLN
ncbi:MAG: hypothetical protein WC848_02555 [Parcubacteria group bacterium]|jgi:hypothetical protein